MEDWPVWATEQVRLAEPGDDWAVRGRELCRRLDRLLAPWLVAPVEHVGSTAVPGLVAKPVIDVQAPVHDLDCVRLVADLLAPDGWHLVPPELDGRPWRRFLVHVVDDHRAAHLHLLRGDGGHWSEQLAFRDALRADPQLAGRYAELKRRLAEDHADDREAYTVGKGEFVRDVLESHPASG